MYGLGVFYLNLVIVLVSCHNDFTQQNGFLSESCVRSYHRMYVTRSVPPRDYEYFHEVSGKTADARSGANTDDDDEGVPASFRIIGGWKDAITSVPFTVGYGPYCGGVLISPRWALTAAHCTPPPSELYVLVGATERSKALRIPVCARFIHPLRRSARNPQDYDYQLLLLERDVPISNRARPIAIGEEYDIQPNEVITVSGWGHMRHKGEMVDGLQTVQLPILSREQCRALPLRTYKDITSRMFCAGVSDGSKDSCQGDSGGPAVVRGKLVGIVSHGVGCAKANQPGVYANVPAVRSWLREVTALPL